MKIRTGFVSNSSSSSFCIDKKNVNEEQIFQIKNYLTEYKKLSPKAIEAYQWSEYDSHIWNIEEDEDTISGWTSMDNFDMDGFLNEIGIKRRHTNFSDGYSSLDDID